jgi:hypothetical protein
MSRSTCERAQRAVSLMARSGHMVTHRPHAWHASGRADDRLTAPVSEEVEPTADGDAGAVFARQDPRASNTS